MGLFFLDWRSLLVIKDNAEYFRISGRRGKVDFLGPSGDGVFCYIRSLMSSLTITVCSIRWCHTVCSRKPNASTNLCPGIIEVNSNHLCSFGERQSGEVITGSERNINFWCVGSRGNLVHISRVSDYRLLVPIYSTFSKRIAWNCSWLILPLNIGWRSNQSKIFTVIFCKSYSIKKSW